MKVMLINPPWYVLLGENYDQLPIGLAYLASYLKQRGGHEVLIFNADFQRAQPHGDISKMYDKFDSYLRVLEDLEHPVWRYVLEEVERFGPDVVGIYAKTGSIKSAQGVAKKLKQLSREVITVVGGPHPTILPAETAAFEYFDYVIKGEGEVTFLELLDKIAKGQGAQGVSGITYKKDGKVIDNPPRPLIEDLDSLPFLEREDILYREGYPKSAFGILFTARGCPFDCTYCASKKMWGRKVRYRSPQNVVREIEEIVNRYHTKFITIRDDTFTLDARRAEEICELIVEKNLGISWHADTRADCANETLVSKMKEAGCVTVSIGIESGSDRILRYVKKGETTQAIASGIKAFKKFGIKVNAFIMMGFPTETKEEVLQTMRFSTGLGVDSLILSILTPYPGTEIYEQMKRDKLLEVEEGKWERFFHQSPDMGLVQNREDFKALVDDCFKIVARYNRTARVKNFAKLAVRNPRLAMRKLKEKILVE